jgi:hypothetical protein
VISESDTSGNKSLPQQVSSTYAFAGVEENGMPHHFKDSQQGHGISLGRVLDRMIVISVSCLALDTGDADDFSFAAAGGLACSRGVRPQGEIAVAA